MHFFFEQSAKPAAANKVVRRGGIPIVFPQFGQGPIMAGQHGFARGTAFRFVKQFTVGAPQEAGSYPVGSLGVVLELVESAKTLEAWNHAFRLTCTFVLTPQSTFIADLGVENPVEATMASAPIGPFDFTSLLHTYFLIENINDISVLGLQGCNYHDKVAKTDNVNESNERVTFAGEVDRVYYNAATRSDSVCVAKEKADTICVRRRGSFTDVVVWNPWVEKTNAMSDLYSDEYTKMVCVELGKVANATTLQPGDVFMAGQEIYVKS